VQLSSKAGGSILSVLILLLIFAFIASHSKLIRENVGNRDSIQYWATGRLLVQHQNPYDPSAVLELERGQEQEGDVIPISRPLMFRVPPWGLFLVAPLGRLGAFWAWLLWFSSLIAAFVFSVRACPGLFGVGGSVAHDCNLAAYLFAPVLACLQTGQIDAFLLVGIILFLRWEKQKPFAAGTALILPFAKPHLFLLFGVACFLWAVSRRRWAILAGFAVALVFSLGVAFWLDPAVFPQYRAMLVQQAIGHEFIPSLAGLFRLVVARQFFWVQLLPGVVGVGWTVWFWLSHRTEWNWREHGLLLLLVSVLVSPYSWLPDEVVLVPTIYRAGTWLFGSRASKKTAMGVSAVIVLNGVLLVMGVFQVPLASGAYVWSGLIWAFWYGLARGAERQNRAGDGLVARSSTTG
jgi:Glycosyltransferase family 87